MSITSDQRPDPLPDVGVLAPGLGGVMVAEPPRFSLKDARGIVAHTWGIAGTPTELVSERDQNIRIDGPDGRAWVLKVSNAIEDPAVVDMEVEAVLHVARVDPDLPVAATRPTLAGDHVTRVRDATGTAHLARLIPLLPGRHGDPHSLSPEALAGFGETLARLGRALRGFFHPAAGRHIAWDLRHLDELAPNLALVADPDGRALVERVLDRWHERLEPRIAGLRGQVIHNDLTIDNTLLDPEGHITAIIDFGDMAHTALVFDLPAALQTLLEGRDDLFDAASAVLAGYVRVTPLEPEEAAIQADLLAARLVQTILISAWRTRRYPDNVYIRGWDLGAWEILRELDKVGWDEADRRLQVAARGARPVSRVPDVQLLARRRAVLGSALSPLTYTRPLHIVRGEGVWLYDADGRAYLDAYNNVPVVGHSHPRVVEAIARQAAILNTNTRYLHETVVELGERLVATMPPGLDTVMFVNSGTEANDLAWRLATTVTGGNGGIVTDFAYHGVSTAIAALSPEAWPRGDRPEWVETFAPPDEARGVVADSHALETAIDRLIGRGTPPAAVYLDALFTSDGVFAPPAAYMRGLVETAAGAGALWVGDEVQGGYGRTGDGPWSLSASGIFPDVVTLGKPMGNGHPVAAVVTRADIADKFAETTEFFSTFGGNPVACAAALAVLDVLEDEGLRANAATVGAALIGDLAALAARHPTIFEVRGRGLMIGVDLVMDDGQPAGVLASRVQNEMRERGVLVGTTGRHSNVLKVRPPLCIDPIQATLIVTTLDEALTAAGARRGLPLATRRFGEDRGRYPPRVTERLVIRAGRLLDLEAGETLTDRDLIVEDGRVTAIEPASATAKPTIDLGGLTVLPGLIDCHSHMVGELEVAGIAASTTSAAEEAMTGVHNARVTLDAGFTTVRDVGTYRAFVDCALRDAINAGWTPGPRMMCAGAYVTTPGGGGSVTGLAPDVTLPADLRLGEVRDETDVRLAVHRLLTGGADFIKVIATGAVLARGTDPGARELSEGQIRAAVDTAAEFGTFVAAHAHGTEGIKTAARAGVRSIEHGSLIDDEGIETLLRYGTYLVADIYDGDHIAVEGRRMGWPEETLRKADDTTEAQRVGFRKAVAAGVRLAYGTDSGVYPHRDVARQLAYMVRYGLSPLATLRSATLWAAELMGWTDQVGSLAPGHFADLVAVDGDPLADVSVLEHPVVVIKGGAVVRDERRRSSQPTGG